MAAHIALQASTAAGALARVPTTRRVDAFQAARRSSGSRCATVLSAVQSDEAQIAHISRRSAAALLSAVPLLLLSPAGLLPTEMLSLRRFAIFRQD